MVALLLYRLLDMMRALTEAGVGLGAAPLMLLDVTPQYLGLALPIGFFVGMFFTLADLSAGNELDALWAGGVSLERLAAPLWAASLAIMAVEVAALGFGEPYGRYAFRMDLESAAHAGFTGELQPGMLTNLGEGAVIGADRVDLTGHGLGRVFLRRTSADGQEEIITAPSGVLSLSADRRQLTLLLKDGQQFSADGVARFGRLNLSMPQPDPRAGLPARGATTDRELTLPELASKALQAEETAQRRAAAAELLARVARIASPPLFPLLAVAAAMGAKRRGRGTAAVLCGLAFYLYENGLDFGQKLAAGGQVLAPAALAAPYAAFAALSLWLFLYSRRRPGEPLLAMASL
jgi:lipopolysaccharide export system permease protein